MVTTQVLDGYLGKHISDICKNAYADDSDNHCAHFTCHALDLAFGTTCKVMGNGKGPGANIRVQQVFAHCQKVGTWASRPSAIHACLVFITNPGNVKVARKFVSNVPRKHMGIYNVGYIWHYSNRLHQVVKQTPDEFSHHYPAPDNAMFYGVVV